MATTTNYSWTTPDDTALVKDGAAAIRTLGSSIDTTTKALNPSTTLGDIEYRSSTANTNTRLGIGTTGQVLSVSGGVPAWTTPAGGGGYTQLATGSLSGATTTISSISGDYRDLVLRVFNYVPASTGGLNMQFNGDSGSNYTSIYYSSSGENTTFGSTYVRLSEDASSSATNGFITSTISEYANTVSRKLLTTLSITEETASPVFNLIGFNGSFNSTSAITSITLLPNSGSFTSGTYYLYGVK